MNFDTSNPYINDLPIYERLVICPYNVAHKVTCHRLMNHLIKCRRSHPTKGTKTCRFSTAHVVRIEEIELHEESCPDRVMVEMMQMFSNNLKVCDSNYAADFEETEDENDTLCNSGIESSAYKSKFEAKEDDDWSDAEVKTYDPREATKDLIIQRKVQHMLPSIRRQKREENRIKNRELAAKLEQQKRENSSKKMSNIEE